MGLLRILIRQIKRRSRTPGNAHAPSKKLDRAFLRRESAIRASNRAKHRETVLCGPCWVIDGDTIVINKIRIRLAGIDAPELDHPWGQQSKWALVQMCKGNMVTAHIRPDLSHDRVVAECFLPDGRDLAAELVQAGLALDWGKYSGGKYRHLEPPDARRKLWRANARQKGRMP